MAQPDPVMSPQEVLDLLQARMWDDGTDDYSRLVLEVAASGYRQLMQRCGHLSMLLERSEARCETLERICYGGQKGGAA
jgi:hypothetical protein